MDDKQLWDRVTAQLATVFECAPVDFQSTTCAADIEKWDSMNNVRMLLQLEKELSIRFSGMEATSLENVGELVDLIKTKLTAA